MEKAIFDASFFLSSLLPDEQQSKKHQFKKALKEFKNGSLILVEPFIFSLEVVNALRYAFASQRISQKELLKTIESFEKLQNINYVYDFDLQKLTKLAVANSLSVYDACYLYLKRETGLKLFSLDKQLAS